MLLFIDKVTTGGSSRSPRFQGCGGQASAFVIIFVLYLNDLPYEALALTSSILPL